MVFLIIPAVALFLPDLSTLLTVLVKSKEEINNRLFRHRLNFCIIVWLSFLIQQEQAAELPEWAAN